MGEKTSVIYDALLRFSAIIGWKGKLFFKQSDIKNIVRISFSDSQALLSSLDLSSN
jgi:hypothetical protein